MMNKDKKKMGYGYGGMTKDTKKMGYGYGGMTKKSGYAKDGMANCGASMKPGQKRTK